MPRSDLPFGSEFSPSQIDLATILEMAQTHAGDWHALEDAIRARYFDSHPTSDYNRRKLANNCKLGMIAYGLIDRNGVLTEFGRELYSLKSDPNKMYEALARHILVDLRGLIVVQTAQDMHTRGERFDLQKLRTWLQERGIHFPRGGKHPSIMRLWLEKAGVVTTPDWQIDTQRLREILGASLETIDQLAMLGIEQKAFLKALANMAGPGPYLSNEVEKLAATIYGAKFDEKNLPKTVLYPLENAGYISLQRGTKIAGRGAKPFLVSLTEKMEAEIIAPLIDCLMSQVQPELRPLLRKPLTEILAEVSSPDRHIKGLALEALAFYLMRLIDLKYVATRLRGQATGGAEVDLIFEGARLIFSRWQIQCKNTRLVSLDDVAKEVGLTIHFGSQVAVIVGVGRISEAARKYAGLVRNGCGKQVILVGRNELLDVANGARSVRHVVESQVPFVLMRAS